MKNENFEKNDKKKRKKKEIENYVENEMLKIFLVSRFIHPILEFTAPLINGNFSSLSGYCFEKNNPNVKSIENFYDVAERVNMTDILYDKNFTALTYVDTLNLGINLVENIRGKKFSINYKTGF